MKVRIYKAPNGKGMFKSSMPKAREGVAVDMDMDSYIDQQLEEGLDPEVIIIGLNESYGKSRGEVKDLVYEKFFNNDFAYQDDDEEEVAAAPYNNPTEDTVVQPEEEEQDNAAAYGYYDDNRQARDLVQEGADDNEENEGMARYGGQYAAGGQFAPGSIIPQPKKPYYIGMDAEPFDNAYKHGGMTKGAYVKQRIKELRKAALGDEVQNNETNISPRGTIDSPSGFTTPEKNVASIIKQTGNEAKLKETAENEYQQYQESTMGDNFNGKFLFGGRNRKIARANRAMFGTSTSVPGADAVYEFGKLGGLRKATVNWDLDAIGGLAQFLPGMRGMMPGMGGRYKAVSYPAQIRKKTVSTINNATLDDVAKQNPNSTAAQNNRSDKKNIISCPPGSVYDSERGHCVDELGNMVRSIVDLPDPEELLGNPFENPNARMLSGKKTMKATGPSSSASSNAASQSTQAPVSGGAPLQSQQGIDYEAWKYAGAQNPFTTRIEREWNEDFGKNIKQSGAKDNPNTSSNESQVWSSPVDQDKYNELMHLYNTIGPEALTPEQLNLIEQSGYITTDDQGNEYSSSNVYNPNPDFDAKLRLMNRMQDVYGKSDWDFLTKNKKLFQKEDGGFVDTENMDPNMLAKFIYGGDEYAYGGDILPQAYDGFAGNFQKQMLDTKNRINQMGRKNPADFNPFKGNAFGKATTGVQPSGTVGNRFQPTGQPNTNQTNTGNGFQAGDEVKGDGSIWRNGKQVSDGKGSIWENKSGPLMGDTRDPNGAAKYAQFMQMMQGQQGANQGASWMGRPQRLGFGLTRDFNYGNSFSPVDWKVPEGTKHIRQETYKDRGKRWNLFDTKKITDYYADPNDEGASDDLINKQGSGKNIKAATTTEESGVDGESAISNDNQPKKSTAEKYGFDEETWSNMSWREQTDAQNAIEDDSKAPMRQPSQISNSVSRQAPETIQSQGETELENNPFTGDAFQGNQFGTAAGVTPSENMKFTQGPNNFNLSANTTNELAGNAFGTSNTGVTGNANMSRPAAPNPTYPQPGVENPMADPKFVPTPQDYNPGSNPASTGTMPSQQSNPNYTEENDPLNQMPMAYGGYMAQGGYVPEYMAYGGYIPHAKTGITVDKPEFSDPNFIGRKTENSAYTFDPKQLGADLFGGKFSLTGIAKSIGEAGSSARQSDLAAQSNRSSDAATANTGQPGFGSAEVTGNDADAGQMASKGNLDQYGVNVGSIGFSGNNVKVKKGGPINSSYSKGKVYSLTMDQIKAIEAAGGKVEYIK